MFHLPAAGGPGGLDGTGDEGNAGPCAFPVERCITRRNLPADANRLGLSLHDSSQIFLYDVGQQLQHICTHTPTWYEQ
jgi:hypothetical protein